MPTIEIEATELQDADVQFVSLVDRGANRIPFRIIKSMTKETPAMTQHQTQKRDLNNLAAVFGVKHRPAQSTRKADSTFGTQRPPVPAPAPAPVAKAQAFNPALRLENPQTRATKAQVPAQAKSTPAPAAPTSASAKTQVQAFIAKSEAIRAKADALTRSLGGTPPVRKADDAKELQDAITIIGTAVETIKGIVGRGIVCQDTADTCRGSLETLKADVEELLGQLPAATVAKSDREFSAFALSPSAWGIRNGHINRLL